MNDVCKYCGEEQAFFNGVTMYCPDCDREWDGEFLFEDDED